MRTTDEVKELVENGLLAKEILDFSQKFRSLIVPAPEVLAETILTLQNTVSLCDRVVPLKSFFNFVQQAMRTSYLANALAVEMTKHDAKEMDAEKLRLLELELRGLGTVYLSRKLIESAVSGVISPEKRTVLEEKTRLRLEQQAKRKLCTEDVFMVACAFLDVEIAKQGHVYYLKGESPEFKETKRHRNPLILTDDVVLKHMSSGLARPDEQRGTVERGQIESGFNHLVRLNELYHTMFAVVKWIADAKAKNLSHRKIDVRKHFDLSHTDYERLMALARREGLTGFKNRKKDPANSYILRANNHQSVLEMAAKLGYSPQKTLNVILDSFWDILEKEEMKVNLDEKQTKK